MFLTFPIRGTLILAVSAGLFLTGWMIGAAGPARCPIAVSPTRILPNYGSSVPNPTEYNSCAPFIDKALATITNSGRHDWPLPAFCQKYLTPDQARQLRIPQ